MSGLVQQRTDHDCVFCCVAMVLGLTYEQAADRAGAAFMEILNAQGCSDAMEQALYRTFGLKKDVDFVERTYSPHWATVQGTKSMLWGRRALLTVRSKNSENGWHMVYWDGERVHDPRQDDRKRYTDWAEVEPLEMILFNEAKKVDLL